MITAIYSFCAFGGVHDVVPWALFWAASLVGYFALFLLLNRSKRGIKNVLLFFLAAEVVFDFIWAILYYFNRFYLEYLVGVTYGLFGWIAVLVIAGVCATVKTYRKR